MADRGGRVTATGGDARPNEVRYFLEQIPGLWAGRPVPRYPLDDEAVGSLDGASPEDLKLILDTAVRQLESAAQQLEQIRQRGQFLFTTLLALVGFAVIALRAVVNDISVVGFLSWAVAIASLMLALLGATSVIVNQKVMGELNAVWLSRQPKPWLHSLAKDALASVSESRRTVANQVTYFRDSALLTILGAFLLALSWLVATL